MRVYSTEEIERLRAIKRLVNELGINLAGIQQLLSIADVVARIRPLLEEAMTRPARQRVLRRVVDRLSQLLRL